MNRVINWISDMIDENTDKNGNTNFYIGDTEIPFDELIEKGLEYLKDVKDFSVECWTVFENPGITVRALSVAWIQKDEGGESLQHYCTTIESF